MVKYPCPKSGCNTVGCYNHCNTCGDDILWRPPNLDLEIVYTGPRPLETSGKVHRCMLNGVKEYQNMSRLYPRRKACVILCPYPKCIKALIDEPPEHELLDQFRDHLMSEHKHELKEEIGVRIYDKKVHIQENNKISYLDPFLHVSMEEINR